MDIICVFPSLKEHQICLQREHLGTHTLGVIRNLRTGHTAICILSTQVFAQLIRIRQANPPFRQARNTLRHHALPRPHNRLRCPGQFSLLQPIASSGRLEGAKIRGRCCVRASNEFEPLRASDTRIRSVRASVVMSKLRGMEGQGSSLSCHDRGLARLRGD